MAIFVITLGVLLKTPPAPDCVWANEEGHFVCKVIVDGKPECYLEGHHEPIFVECK